MQINKHKPTPDFQMNKTFPLLQRFIFYCALLHLASVKSEAMTNIDVLRQLNYSQNCLLELGSMKGSLYNA